MSTDNMSTEVTTGEVRLSFVNVWQPKQVERVVNGNKVMVDQYSVKVLVPKSDTKTVAALQAAQKAALEKGKAEKFGGKLVGVKTILRDGDVELAEGITDDQTVAGCIFFNATSKNQPQVLMKGLIPCTDKTKLYSGVYAHVNVNFYPYKVDGAGGTKGVSAGLNAILIKRDGEALAASFTEADAVNAFSAVVEDDDEI